MMQEPLKKLEAAIAQCHAELADIGSVLLSRVRDNGDPNYAEEVKAAEEASTKLLSAVDAYREHIRTNMTGETKPEIKLPGVIH